MSRKYLRRILVIVLLAMIAAAAAAPIRFPKEEAGPWMAKLADERPLNTLSLPGTHDSGALYSIGDLFGKCQSLPVSRQLQIGVRFLDLRLRLVGDELMVYHNIVEQKTAFSRLLPQLVRFLEDNPSEFLIVSIKEEGAPVRSSADFSQTLEAMLLQYPRQVSSLQTLPETVAEARGRIHVLARYEENTLGVPCEADWQDNTAFSLGNLYVQDHYKLSTAGEKQSDILETFRAAESGDYSLVLNFASCYFPKGFPPSYAGIPARSINPWLLETLREGEGPAGVLVCDFITSELAQAIIGRNFP